ncbi:hypothetical protein ERO13_D08G063600v2 [Gossypium hirsutum]|uniref:Uncharacterized protein n=5 Tax=Gossypium TaxID=3633 RepID=A0A1U8KI26_GOSHI|nr:uncharacterized protein LOC107915715 [Gossypium hirsutum]KAB2015994.1 hypothetical protein ES319_D08G065400v1 [Gossypium barbadense]TYG56515.1 hypothetical protein ES288_D08G070100v1 [Gossypium darwinii]TYH57134.1 hypothetical protein ES332_D08G068700v1 [Gossypium tomentosum]TYI68119.1 hypothetical protein E1A91_D08G067200v1 [Gossypium mustelinum]KAG4132943.1 hypothetical protein ERO13_D08G063600v2 [Gossypium hirsutum]
MGIVGEEPVLSRLDRVDNMVRQLEEMRGSHGNGNYNRSPSPRSSSASTPSSGTLGSTCTEGHPSSIDFSPTAKSLEKYCRPIDHVMVETQLKGTLLQRLDQVEDRLLKLCVQLEEELEEEKKREAVHVEKKGHKKGIKQFVKQCVKGKHSKQHKGTEWNGKAKSSLSLSLGSNIK